MYGFSVINNIIRLKIYFVRKNYVDIKTYEVILGFKELIKGGVK